MILSKKLAAALLLIPVLFIGAFLVSVLGAYGSFSNIPHHDVVMWTFWAIFGLIIALMFLAILILIVTLQDELVKSAPAIWGEEDGSYIEISDDIMEEPIEVPLEEITEEEAPEELQTEEALEIEVPEPSEMSIDDQEPQEHENRKASEIQPPAIWGEEEFE